MIRYHRYLAEMMVHRDEITPDPLNDNNGDVDELMESISVNGCYRQIYASAETKHIVGGHTLYQALLEMGATYVPVGWLDGDDEQARRMLVGDNQIARRARPDPALTVQLLNGLRMSEIGLRGSGFTEDDYMRLIAKVPSMGGGSLPQIHEPAILRQTVCPECGHRWTP